MSTPNGDTRHVAFICSKGTLDMVYPALVMGRAALGNGIDVTIFFTFWGMDMIRRPGSITWNSRPWPTPA
ncbi:MAG: DsrE/DsrF/DrsH-like family protein [Caldilineales bacterium]|nr:DsrE/DsrF/DrsH-like family protein [Caldilineales bacterium]